LPKIVREGGTMARHRVNRPVLRSEVFDREEKREPGLSRGVQDHIGSKLRAMYDDLKDRPIPDRILELLGDLDRDLSQGTKRDG
jgi:anti-sigma factor NepR-like protein